MNPDVMISSETMFFASPISMLIMAVLFVLPFWFIFGKAGHSKWLSLLMLIPMLNIVMLYYLAFSSWPALKKSQS